MKKLLTARSLEILNLIAQRGGQFRLECELMGKTNSVGMGYYIGAKLRTPQGLELVVESKFSDDPNELLEGIWQQFEVVLQTQAGRKFNTQAALEYSPAENASDTDEDETVKAYDVPAEDASDMNSDMPF